MQVLYKYRALPIHLELHSSYSTPLTDYLRLSRLNPIPRRVLGTASQVGVR
jgi:hypothetical protein